MRKRHPKMKKSNLVILSICVSFCFNPFVLAQNAAVVNGKPIPLAKLTRMLEKSGQMNSPDVKEKARDVLITKELILQEADKRGLTKNEEVRDAMEQARLSVLVSAVFEDYISKDGISDKDLLPVYEKVKGQFGGKQYKVRHILVENEKLANTLQAQIKGGANFSDLAKTNSKDQGSAPNGGSLDWVTASGLVPEFAQVMTTLKAGELASSPVKSQFGWHIIQVDEIKDTPTPSMQEVKPQLVQMLTQDQNWQKFKFSEMMEKFKSKAKIQ